MLRVLSNSVIDTTNDKGEDGQLPLKFSYVNPNGEKLTGKWENDQKLMIKLDPQTERSRLIMGLGPSVGKTFF